MTKHRRMVMRLVLGVGGLLAAWVMLPAAHTQAASGFSVQVTPSPLVATVKPGESKQLELKIRNGGTDRENLQIAARSFRYDATSQQITLNDEKPADISDWIHFSEPKFSVDPNQTITEHISLNVPREAGFSYSFALVISRQSEPNPTQGGRLIKGSLAVFTLVNVDKPGATRKLEIVKISSRRSLYEFLPAQFDVTLKNTGNTIVQPYGNVFIQRGSTSKSPIATLPFNDTRGYILPGTERTVTVTWADGWPVYTDHTNDDGATSQKLSWSDGTLSKFRIGTYTAKVVAVYNDGHRDTPIEGEVSFWVIPWRGILLLLVLIVGGYFLQRWRGKRRTEKAVKKALEAAQAGKDKSKGDES